jgi:hypothetical protein
LRQAPQYEFVLTVGEIGLLDTVQRNVIAHLAGRVLAEAAAALMLKWPAELPCS